MEKMLLSTTASLFGVIIGLLVYIWTRTISEQDKINTEHSADIKCLKDRMTTIETKHNDKMCERSKK